MTLLLKIQKRFKSFIPSREHVKDKKLLNRMKLCALSIFLLWTASLKTAVFISSTVIDVPSSNFLLKSCETAFLVATDEKHNFQQCVDNQLERCFSDLKGAVSTEGTRIKVLADQNAALVDYVQNLAKECSQDYIGIRESLDGWVGKLNSIPFNNDTCGMEEQIELSNSFGDVTLFQEETMTLTNKYINEGSNSLQAIVKYIKAREDYDRSYIMNHTKVMSNQLKQFFELSRPGLPDGIFPNFPIQMFKGKVDHIFEVISIQTLGCFTFDRALERYCDFHPDWNWELDSTFLGYFNDNVANKSIELLNDFGEYYNQKIHEINATRQKWNSVKEVVVSIFEKVNSTLIPDFGLAFPGVSLMNNNLKMFFPGFQFAPDVSKFLQLQEEWNTLYDGINSKFSSAGANAYEKFMNGTVIPDLLNWKFRLVQEADKLNELSWRWHQCMHSKMSRLSDQMTNDAENNIYQSDYDPPPYYGSQPNITKLEDELKLFETKGENFARDSRDSFGMFDTKSDVDDYDDIFKLPTFNMTAVKGKLNTFQTSFEKFFSPDINFYTWFLEFLSLGNFIFLFDFGLRAYFSLRLCFRYWDVSSVALPKVDIRAQKETSNPLEMSSGRLLIECLTNPAVGTLFGLLIIFWIFMIIASVYSPLLMEFRQYCVPMNGEGTFIGTNIFSVAFNFAYERGTSSRIEGLESFEIQRVSTCSSLQSKSIQDMNGAAFELLAHNKTFTTIGNRIDILERCIAIDVLDRYFEEACCGEIGYEACDQNENELPELESRCPLMQNMFGVSPLKSPSFYFSKRSCDVIDRQDEWVLQDAIFDCQALPSCDVTCNGPQKQKLQQVTKECSCMFEWFLHSLCLRMILSVLIFGLMNGSRVIFVDGLARVMWRRLHPGTFSVWATCDVDGVLLTPDLIDHDLSQEDYSMEVDMKSQIERNTRWFRLGGCMMMVGAVCMNICWIVLILKVPDMTRLDWFEYLKSG